VCGSDLTCGSNPCEVQDVRFFAKVFRLEVWDDMGIARDMIDAGIWIDTVRSIFNGQVTDLTDDLSDLPFARLGLPQITVPVYQDAGGGFKAAYGSKRFAMLVRPDGHLAWRGESWREPALRRQLDRTFAHGPYRS
jgi:hypothetical protein